MESQSDNTRRIAKNTIMLYVRMLFSMTVSLYTTRVILATLGAEDYGITNVVGGIVGLMGMLTSLLSQGTSRFITIALGKQDQKILKNTFLASVTIHLCLAAVLLFIGEIFSPLIFEHINIEPSRLHAAHYVYHFCLISAILGIIQSPYNAAIIAHERMDIFAYISIWDVLAKLGIVFLLTVGNLDKLILYSILTFVIGIITSLIYLSYCVRNFQECKSLKFRFDKALYKEILNYTGWNAIGSLAFTMNGQGITILLSAFGTAVNAARGLAGTVSNFVYKFVSSFQTAAQPQIVKLCATNKLEEMNHLIQNVSRYSSLLVGALGVPLFVEMDFFLTLWLKDVPEFTATFARLALVQGLIQAIDIPIGMGIHAVGKMKLPNITSAFVYMMILPVSYFLIKAGATPNVTYIVTVLVYPIALIIDLAILKKYSDFNIKSFVITILPIVASIILFCFLGIFLSFNYSSSDVWNNIINIFILLILTAVTMLFVGLKKSERRALVYFVKSKLKK